MNQRSPGLAFARGSVAPPSVLRGRRLLLVRAAWVVLVVIVLGLDMAGIPHAYGQYVSRLTPEDARELERLAA